MSDPVHRAIEAVYRIERARLIAGLARWTRDVDRAEELAHDALLAALTTWPASGVPRNPGAWLMTTARRRGIDGMRRRQMQRRKHDEIEHARATHHDTRFEGIEAALDDDIGDELLGLVFAACHPILTPDARAALTLRLIGGLTTAEIARAFLTAEPTIGKRIVRAKRRLREADVRFEVPRGDARRARLDSVLEVVYLIFNEGYAATAGDELLRPTLTTEALRLGRILTARLPDEPEVWGLLALMELHAARFATRVGPDGAPVPLPEQDRARWDRLLINRGLTALDRAEAQSPAPPGRYTLHAALVACHARARRWTDTDWPRIAALYDTLRVVQPGPVVELNRAIAHSHAHGPRAGLALLAPLTDDPALRSYAPLPAARGDCLLRAGRADEARRCFEEAAALTQNAAERAFLLRRAAALETEVDAP